MARTSNRTDLNVLAAATFITLAIVAVLVAGTMSPGALYTLVLVAAAGLALSGILLAFRSLSKRRRPA